MSLQVRVDDFPGTKPAEFFKHNLPNFKFFNDVLKSRGISYILGVIPYYTTPHDLEFLKSQDHVIVALHGIAHSEIHLDEFHGFGYQQVWNALSITKGRLEASLETRVVDYIPPHNVISPDTVLSLSRLGFERVYGGPETNDDMKSFIKLNGMDYIHSEPPLEYGRSDELLERGSVPYLLDESKKRDIYLGLHWPWEYNIGLDHLRKYLDLLADAF